VHTRPAVTRKKINKRGKRPKILQSLRRFSPRGGNAIEDNGGDRTLVDRLEHTVIREIHILRLVAQGMEVIVETGASISP
jgi:hypothetical protein